ncbi:glycosyltransferase family 2 protein [Jannaschia sp. M317]|uniref:glycosyltransferase family 2 protein n=1 Tax=Jannaschia sp. M317 TaxID=2867011 RepID=UPI0021A5B69B|nr:glycosyltransferase family 2 protein [Jannaschia sp. M317]UWQ16400.1 glycosyltransferase [Jannaschia sp. M317]
MPMFSIILPCYNAQATIGQTLDSLRAQSFEDWEAICVDDGSTDRTVDLVLDAAMCDARIRIGPNPGKGPSQARNFGAMIASGEVLAFCDADDIWLPGKLAELAETFTDPDIDGAYGQIGFFQDVISDASVFSTVPGGDLTIPMLLGENPVCTMSNIALRREAFARAGGFDVTMVHSEDLEWLIRLVGAGARITGLPTLQTMYRTSVGGLSTDLDAMLAGRTRAIETAARFGIHPTAQDHAIHHRYLARRALRLGDARTRALRHAMTGLRHSPAGFFKPFRRGALTLAGACGALALPRATCQSLFS